MVEIQTTSKSSRTSGTDFGVLHERADTHKSDGDVGTRVKEGARRLLVSND